MSAERDEYGTLYRKARRLGGIVTQKCRRTTNADGRKGYSVEVKGVGRQRDYWRYVPPAYAALRKKIDDALAIYATE